MIVGIPTEVKDSEYRVAATPEGVRELVLEGNDVLVQSGAGDGSAFADEEFAAAGARVVPDADAVFAAANMIVKVKEPQPQEYERFRPGQTLFTYLHLAADRELTEFLMARSVAAVAYETVMLPDGRLPLLAPMSEIAGRMAPQEGAKFLERPLGGRGVLMGGAAGVAPANVVVLGAGMAGTSAAWIAAGMEAQVTILDLDPDRLRQVDRHQRGRIQTLSSSALALERLVADADLVIGAVLVPGARAPRIVTEPMVQTMRVGSVIVDLSIDQGGCVETSRMTTHTEPTYVLHGVVHYCVGNMPGAVPRTSTYALTNATRPFVAAIAREGLSAACTRDPALASGVNVLDGHVTNAGVAAAHELEGVAVERALAGS